MHKEFDDNLMKPKNTVDFAHHLHIWGAVAAAAPFIPLLSGHLKAIWFAS